LLASVRQRACFLKMYQTTWKRWRHSAGLKSPTTDPHLVVLQSVHAYLL